MTYRLAADGGGTKLSCVLYKESGDLVSKARAGGTNSIFRPVQDIIASMDGLLDRLLPPDADSIDVLDECIVGGRDLFLERLTKRVKVLRHCSHTEARVGLACCGMSEGFLTLSGTGSDAFYVTDTVTESVGGWGALLGDEGSGYDIGLMTVKSAIYAKDGRGEPTVLYDTVREHFGITELWDVINMLARTPDYRREIADCARLASKAAADGDAVAISVYRRAAESLSSQVIPLIRRHRPGPGAEIVIGLTGGAWKGSPVMSEHFLSCVCRAFPDLSVSLRHPLIEPVIGCIAVREIAGAANPRDDAMRICSDLREKFPDFSLNG